MTKKEKQELENFKNAYDWQHAFYEAVHGEYGPSYGAKEGERGPIENVSAIIACAEGDNDGPDWLALVKWKGKEGKYAKMFAGCDYTGWD